MKKNNSTHNSENQNTSNDVYLRSLTESSTENNDNIDIPKKESSMLNVEDILHDNTDNKNNKTGADDLIQDILDDQPSYSPTDYMETLNNDIDHNDETDFDGILSDISNEEENTNQASPADITDALNDDDKTDIDDFLQNILNDNDNENQPSPADSTNSLNDGDEDFINAIDHNDETDINDIVQNILNDAGYKNQPSSVDDPIDDPIDDIGTLNTANEVNTNKIENINDETEADLLKTILGDQYQDSQSLINNVHDIDIHDSSVYLSQAEDSTNNQLDQKLVKLENLWDELSSIWPAINEQPEKKIKIEDLWQSLKKGDDDNTKDISFIDNAFNDTLINITHDKFETTLDEINHILGYDINLEIPDTDNIYVDGESTEESGIDLSEEDTLLTTSLYEADSSLDQLESEITNLYSIDQDDRTDLADSSEDDIENSDTSIVERILNDEDESAIDALIENASDTPIFSNPLPLEEDYLEEDYLKENNSEENDSDELIDSILNKTADSSIENISIIETIKSTEDTETESSVTDDLAPLLSGHEDSSDNLESLLSSLKSETDISTDETISEVINHEDTLVESKVSLQALENKADAFLYYSEKTPEDIIDSIDNTLENIKTCTKKPSPVTRKPIENKNEKENEKYSDKTTYSRMPTPDYTSTLERNTTSVSDNTDKTSSRKTTTNLTLAATVATIAFASWVYFTGDELKTEKLHTDTIKSKPIIASIAKNPKNISVREPTKYTPDSNTETSSQPTTELSLSDHAEITRFETEPMDTTYQEPTEYSPEGSLSDTEASSHDASQDTSQATFTTSTDFNQADYAEADPVNDFSEYGAVNGVADNEVTQQQGIYEPEQIDSNATSTIEDKNISDNGTLAFKPHDEFESVDLYKINDQPVEPGLNSPTSDNETIFEQPKLYEWSLNLSSINRTIEPAKDITDFLNNLNIPAEVKQVNIDGKIWFRIRIKGFTSKQDALNYMLTIQERTSINKYWISKRILSEQNLE